jgi:hypothetical protein
MTQKYKKPAKTRERDRNEASPLSRQNAAQKNYILRAEFPFSPHRQCFTVFRPGAEI